MSDHSLDSVRAQVMIVERGGEVYVFAEDYAALLAERDALEAEKQRLRGVASSLVSVAEGYQNMPGFFLHPMLAAQCKITRGVLAEQEKKDG